ATPGEEASDRSRWVAIGLVATTSSLPGRPWLWNSSASWSVNVGRAQRPSFFEDISTPYKPLADGRLAKGSGSNAHTSRQASANRRPARLRRHAGGGRAASTAAGCPNRLNAAGERGKR